MPAILYPTHPARLAYVTQPWTDPTGKQWLWDGSKLRWSALVLPGPKGVSIISGTTPPTDPEEGDPWFDTETGTLAVWSEAQATWIETSGPAGPEGTTESILEKLEGASPVANKIGPEYLPAGGSSGSLNIDGGTPSSNYTSIPAIDGGTP